MHNILNTVTLASFVWATVPALAGENNVMLYKNPQCGCCGGHAEHLRQSGFNVTEQVTHDLAQMSQEAGIPEELQGCHLAFIDGYVVSGHVPARTVRKLLTERPDIKGVTLPGMPTGSPGMPGPKEGPLVIIEITKSGTVGEVYERE